MRIPLYLFPGVLAAASLSAQQIALDVMGTPDDHQITWTAESGFNYQVFVGTDLEAWVDTGINEPGLGNPVTYQCSCQAPFPDDLYYQVRATADLYNEAFLTRPVQAEEFGLLDGVCFAFNLSVFPNDPEKIRIYKREFNVGAPWELIGELTEFDLRRGVRFVRGSAVWIPEPEDEGDFEVQAAALDSTGTVIASAIRMVTIGTLPPPAITITGLAFPNDDPLPALFTFTVTQVPEADPANNPVRRVEFYDDGLLIGTDFGPLFGNSLQNPLHEPTSAWGLLRGTHEITAKVYDARGGIGETADPFVVVVPDGKARPELDLVSPLNEVFVQQGQSFTISYLYDDPDGTADVEWITVEDLVTSDQVAFDIDPPFDPFLISTTGWALGTHLLDIYATDFSPDAARSYPQYVTVHVRSGVGQTFAEALVANIAADDNSVTPSNERFAGMELSTTEFTNGFMSGLEIDSGIVLTSGAAELWNAGDIFEEADEDVLVEFLNTQEPGDLQLEDRLVGYATTDAAVLEFDLGCVHGQLELEYQFGSEEYSEAVGFFNDGFMVLIDDVVVSLLPDCSDFVAVDSVSDVSGFDANVHLYLDDDDDIATKIPTPDPRIEYDGITIALKVHAFVTAGQTHRLRFVIADTDWLGSRDDFWDSALFIGSDSVRTVPLSP